MANRGNRNKLVVPGVEQYLNNFKNEIAAELGIQNYDQIDKGALPARVHGMIGGSMTKRLIELGQQALMSGQPLSESNLDPHEYIKQMQSEISEGMVDAYNNAPVVPTFDEAAVTKENTVH